MRQAPSTAAHSSQPTRCTRLDRVLAMFCRSDAVRPTAHIGQLANLRIFRQSTEGALSELPSVSSRVFPIAACGTCQQRCDKPFSTRCRPRLRTSPSSTFGPPSYERRGMALWGPCVSRNQLVVPAGLRKRSTCPSQRAFGVTRQITLPTSSATSSAPRLSDATPTGRPCALPSASRNPSSTVIGGPLGLPSANGTNNTL